MRRGKLDDYLPALMRLRDDDSSQLLLAQSNIPIQQQWVAVYTTSEDAPTADEIAQQLTPPSTLNTTVMMNDARVIALAAAVVDAIDQTLETLAERPKGEVVTWFLPWAARYHEISQSAGRTFDWRAVVDHRADSKNDVQQSSEGEPAVETILVSSSVAESWDQLDRRVATIISRFLPEDFQWTEPLFAVNRFDGYTLTAVHKVSPATPVMSIQTMSSGMKDLRQFLANGLTLILVCGLLVLLWPLRRNVERVIVHPAVWMGLLGLFGLFVAPLPVAIAVIVLALALPLMTIAEAGK